MGPVRVYQTLVSVTPRLWLDGLSGAPVELDPKARSPFGLPHIGLYQIHPRLWLRPQVQLPRCLLHLHQEAENIQHPR